MQLAALEEKNQTVRPLYEHVATLHQRSDLLHKMSCDIIYNADRSARVGVLILSGILLCKGLAFSFALSVLLSVFLISLVP